MFADLCCLGLRREGGANVSQKLADKYVGLHVTLTAVSPRAPAAKGVAGGQDLPSRVHLDAHTITAPRRFNAAARLCLQHHKLRFGVSAGPVARGVCTAPVSVALGSLGADSA